MSASTQILFNNTYHVELIDSTSGKVKQNGTFHNLTTNNIGRMLLGTVNGASYTNRGYIVSYIAVGSGTAMPQQSNISLTKQLWSAPAIAQSSSIEWTGEHSARQTYSCTFPANSSYVGTVTEVGIRGGIYGDSPLTTHSLLTDSEGQQISFNKTDLDILTVTVTIEISLVSEVEDFKLFNKPYGIAASLVANINPVSTSRSVFSGALNLCRFHYTLDTYDSLNESAALDYVPPFYTLAGRHDLPNRSGYLAYDVQRIGTDTITSERYYKGIALSSLGYWKLPNENVFPAYTIKNLSIGVGDGATTSFNNPLCYFKKNSDKIYKNGTLLTRDVDYTINNVGNAKCLPEVAEFSIPTIVKSNATTSTTLNGWMPLFRPSAVGNLSKASFLSSSNPLYLEYPEEVTLNCLVSKGEWKSPSGTNGHNNLSSSVVFYLDYSIDGINYEEVGQVNYSSSFNIDFENTTAKYWRLRTSSTSTIGMYQSYSEDCYLMLNFKDPYIVFTEAPASGDVLTMDVDMDIIMKNSNFVIDASVRLDVTW